MNTVRAAAPQLEGLEPYDPKYLPAQVMISANENGNDVPADIRAEIAAALAQVPLNRYPDPLANDLRDMIAQHYALAREQVLVGNGGDELLFDIALAWGGEGRTMLNLPPTFSVYAFNAELLNTKVVDVPRCADMSIDEDAVLARLAQGDIDYLIITSPNNPTGGAARTAFVERVLESTNALVLVDEAYGEFSGTSVVPLIEQHKNLLVLRTFSKAFALAGVRIGYVLGNAQVINEFVKFRQPYSVDAVSQTIAKTVWAHRDYFYEQARDIAARRERMAAALRDMPGVRTVYASDANFLLIDVPQSAEVWQRLYDKSVLVRDFSGTPGIESCLRITAGTPEENSRFLAALAEVLAELKE